jgi:exoribonuclease-2
LTVAENVKKDAVRIHVAVADVDALVPKGTPIDEHARQNTTSVYTPTRVFPMLPERLSTNLTSLNPEQDRIAMVISYTVGPDGTVEDGMVRRARVRNYAKLAYNSVDAWLEGNGSHPSGNGRSRRYGRSDPDSGRSGAAAQAKTI